jgi:hypothetical protein
MAQLNTSQYKTGKGHGKQLVFKFPMERIKPHQFSHLPIPNTLNIASGTAMQFRRRVVKMEVKLK